MLKRIFFSVAVASLGLPHLVAAQKYNIVNDTIRVSSSSFPFIRFMGEVQSASLLCEDYKIARTSTTITVRPKASKPAPFCMLVVTEGSASSPRQHQFIISFAKEVPASALMHDYSTKALIEKRMEEIEKGQPAAPAGDDGKAEAASSGSKGLKGLFKKGPKAPKSPKMEQPEAPKQPEAPRQPETPKNEVKAPKEPKETKTASRDREEEPRRNEEPTRSSSSSSGSNDGAQSNGGGDDGDIKNIPADKLEERVKLKITSFYDACNLLCAKQDIEESIKYGMKLFNNDESVLVETTNGKTNAKSQKNIRPYFNHLSQLRYSKVEMTTSEIRFVSNFHLGPDKKWHASAVIIQDFHGYKDNELVYTDKTNKTIDIIVNIFDVIKDGKVVKKFDIFLGNISVTNIP